METNKWDLILNSILACAILAAIVLIIYYFSGGLSSCTICASVSKKQQIETFTNSNVVDPIPSPSPSTINMSDKPEQQAETLFNKNLPAYLEYAYDKNIHDNVMPFLKNQSEINEMSDKLANINATLEANLNKVKLISANGELTFY